MYTVIPVRMGCITPFCVLHWIRSKAFSSDMFSSFLTAAGQYVVIQTTDDRQMTVSVRNQAFCRLWIKSINSANFGHGQQGRLSGTAYGRPWKMSLLRKKQEKWKQNHLFKPMAHNVMMTTTDQIYCRGMRGFPRRRCNFVICFKNYPCTVVTLNIGHDRGSTHCGRVWNNKSSQFLSEIRTDLWHSRIIIVFKAISQLSFYKKSTMTYNTP